MDRHTQFPRLAQKLFNRPLAITPDKAEVVIAALAERLGVTSIFRADGVVVRPQGLFYMDDDELQAPDPYRDRGYDLLGPVAVIAVEGTLVQKYAGTLRPESGMTGYNGIRQNFLTALTDPKVEAIAFDIDSPGGEVAGCFDLVDTIFAARGKKPIWAILNENACSAAYALASAADHITMPRTGSAGSIGVIWMHVDFSKALAGAGIAVTFVQYGARKSDGAPEKALDPEAQKRIQAEINAMGELFVSTVARNRKVDPAAIRSTEAGIFLGDAATQIGIIDAIAPPDIAFRQLLAALG